MRNEPRLKLRCWLNNRPHDRSCNQVGCFIKFKLCDFAVELEGGAMQQTDDVIGRHIEPMITAIVIVKDIQNTATNFGNWPFDDANKGKLDIHPGVPAQGLNPHERVGA